MTNGGYCTISEAVTILRVSRRTIRRWIAAGDLLAEKLGDNTSAWLLNRGDVERLAAKRRTENVA